MTYWEPDIEPVPPGCDPARQILNLDRNFARGPNFLERSPDYMSRWVPDGYKRRHDKHWSDFRDLPVMLLPDADWEGEFGEMSGQTVPKPTTALPPKAPPKMPASPKGPPPSVSVVTGKAPPPPKGPPPKVSPVAAASTDIRIGQKDISTVTVLPKRRSAPEDSGGSLPAAGVPEKRRSAPEDSGGSLPAARVPEKAQTVADKDTPEGSGRSLLAAGSPGDGDEESGGAWTVVMPHGAKRPKAEREKVSEEAQARAPNIIQMVEMFNQKEPVAEGPESRAVPMEQQVEQLVKEQVQKEFEAEEAEVEQQSKLHVEG